MKSLVFLENPAQWRVFKRRARQPLRAYRLLVRNEGAMAAVFKEAGRLGLDVGPVESLESESWYAGVEAAALESARAWHQDPVLKSLLDYRGLNLGFLTEFFTARQLIWQFKSARFLKHALEAHPNASICVFDTNLPFRLDLLPAPLEPIWNRQLPAFALARGLSVAERWTVDWRPPSKTGRAKSFLTQAVNEILGWVGRRFGTARCAVGPSILIAADYTVIGDLIPCLRQRGWQRFVGFEPRLTPARRGEDRRRGVRSLCFQDRSLGRRLQSRRKAKAIWRSRSKDFLSRMAERPPFFFEGVDAGPWMRERLRHLLEDRFIRVASWIDGFHEFLESEHVERVVVDEDVIDPRKTLVNVAKSRGIPSVVMLHGGFPRTSGIDRIPLSADRLAVPGPALKADLVDAGISPDRLVVTGPPKYDLILRVDRSGERERMRKRLGLSPDAVVVSVMSTFVDSQVKVGRTAGELTAALGDVLDAFGAYPNVHLIVKLHPTDPHPDWTRRLLKDQPRRKVNLLQHESSISVMAASDLVLTFWSNTILEGFSLGVPLLVLDYFVCEPARLLPITALNGRSLLVHNRQELDAALGWALGRDAVYEAAVAENSERIVREFLFRLDGQSADRLAALVHDQIIVEPPQTKSWPPTT